MLFLQHLNQQQNYSQKDTFKIVFMYKAMMLDSQTWTKTQKYQEIIICLHRNPTLHFKTHKILSNPYKLEFYVEL